MKKCFKCLEEKSYDNFYKHKETADGYLNKCKICTKKDSINHRINNLDRVKEYDRNRPNQRKRNQKNKIYAQNNKEKVNNIKKEWISNNRIKREAHIAVQNALRQGIIIKANCEICNEIKSEAHHDDYSKPLEVRWLCSRHHKQWHKEQRKLLNNPSFS